MGKFFREHIFGMLLFAVGTSVGASALWDWVNARGAPNSTWSAGTTGPSFIPVTTMESFVGKHPHALLNDKRAQPAFKALLGPYYARFRENIIVASPIVRSDSSYFGSGLAPHMGGDYEAAFALDKASGDLYAAIMEDGSNFDGTRKLRYFGAADARTLPYPLFDWLIKQQEMFDRTEKGVQE